MVAAHALEDPGPQRPQGGGPDLPVGVHLGAGQVVAVVAEGGRALGVVPVADAAVGVTDVRRGDRRAGQVAAEQVVHGEEVAPALAHGTGLLRAERAQPAAADVAVGQSVRVLVLDDRGVEVAVAGRGLEDVVHELPQVHVGEAGDAVGQGQHVGVVAAQGQHRRGEVEGTGLGAAHDRVPTQRQRAGGRVVDQLEVAAGLGEAELVVRVVDPVVVVEEVGGRRVGVGHERGGRAVAGAPAVGELVVELRRQADRPVVLVGRDQRDGPGDRGVRVVTERGRAGEAEQPGRVHPAAGAGLGGVEALDDGLAALLGARVVLVDRALGVLHEALAQQRCAGLGVDDDGVRLVHALHDQGRERGAATGSGREGDPADPLGGDQAAGLEDLVAALGVPGRHGRPVLQVGAQAADRALQGLARREVEGALQAGRADGVAGVADDPALLVDHHREDPAEPGGDATEGLGEAHDPGVDLRQLVVAHDLERGDVTGGQAERRGVVGEPAASQVDRLLAARAREEPTGHRDAARGAGAVPGDLRPAQGTGRTALGRGGREDGVGDAAVEGQARQQLSAEREQHARPVRGQQVEDLAGRGGAGLGRLGERRGRDHGSGEASQRDLAGERHVRPLG